MGSGSGLPGLVLLGKLLHPLLELRPEVSDQALGWGWGCREHCVKQSLKAPPTPNAQALTPCAPLGQVLTPVRQHTCTGHAAPSPRAQMVWPSICLLISHRESISAGRASPLTKRAITLFIQSTPVPGQQEMACWPPRPGCRGWNPRGAGHGVGGLREATASWAPAAVYSGSGAYATCAPCPTQARREPQRNPQPAQHAYPRGTGYTGHSSHACRTR